MKLKEQLKFLLEHRGMNAAQLARAAKLPRQNISNWLMGQKPKDIDQVKQVADLFGVSLDKLLYGEPDDLTFSKKFVGQVLEVKIMRVIDDNY